MSDYSSCELIVVLEDKRHERFVLKTLAKLGFKKHNFRIRMARPGKGAAEQWVRQAYVVEVGLYRKRSKAVRPNSSVLTVIDADTLSVDERKRQLDEGLMSESMDYRSVDESIAVWVPRRHIETWLVRLCGGFVTEEDDVKRQRLTVDEPNAAKEFVRLFHEQKQSPVDTLPSIASALEETFRIHD